MDFQKLPIKKFTPILTSGDDVDKEAATYWQKYSSPVIMKEFASVNDIHFSSTDFAVSSSTRVSIYQTKASVMGPAMSVKKTITRFKDTVYAAAFRPDGKLLAAGDGSGVIQVFDLSSRAILRTFNGHNGAIKSLLFEPKRIISGADDSTVRLWDMPNEESIAVLQGHTDHVRCVQTFNDFVLSGSYDHTIRLWDPRTNKCEMVMDQQDPIEALVVLNGGLIAAAGGNTIKIWDILSGGKMIHSMSAHQKNITCLALDKTNSYLLSGSLDHHLKITSLVNYHVVSHFKYPCPILSMAVSDDNNHLAVGMSGGTLSVRSRPVKVVAAEKKAPRPGSFKYFLRGSIQPDTEIVQRQRKAKLHRYDKLLKSFQYSNALDSVLEGAPSPVLVVSMMEELQIRGGLLIALSGRDEKSLNPILTFMIRYLTNPRYSILLEAALLILDIYGALIDSDLLNQLSVKVKQEMAVQQNLMKLMGMLETLSFKRLL